MGFPWHRAGSIPNRPAAISAPRSRSESSTRRAYPLDSVTLGASLPKQHRRCSSMAEHQLPKLNTRVRFPSSAPLFGQGIQPVRLAEFCGWYADLLSEDRRSPMARPSLNETSRGQIGAGRRDGRSRAPTSQETVSPPSLCEVGCLNLLLARRGRVRATSRRVYAPAKPANGWLA
jgi:hypothetical protein